MASYNRPAPTNDPLPSLMVGVWLGKMRRMSNIHLVEVRYCEGAFLPKWPLIDVSSFSAACVVFLLFFFLML